MGETASAAGKYYFLKDEKSYLHSILSSEALFTYDFFFSCSHFSLSIICVQ